MRLTRFVLTPMATVVVTILIAVRPGRRERWPRTMARASWRRTSRLSSVSVVLTGQVSALGVWTTIFNLDLSKASIDASAQSGCGLERRRHAGRRRGRAPNSALGISVFSGGLLTGSATSSLRLR